MAEDSQSGGVEEQGDDYRLIYYESSEEGNVRELSAYQRVDRSPPKKTAEDYQGAPEDTQIDKEVMQAHQNTVPADPNQEDRKNRIKKITSTEHSKRPANPRWENGMAKIGHGAKNMYWTDKSCGTNIPDPANPGFMASSQDGFQTASAGMGNESDVDISKDIHNEDVINPRLRYQGTNVVQHFSPVIRKPNRWTTKIIKSVAAPLIAITKAMMEEENA